MWEFDGIEVAREDDQSAVHIYCPFNPDRGLPMFRRMYKRWTEADRPDHFIVWTDRANSELAIDLECLRMATGARIVLRTTGFVGPCPGRWLINGQIHEQLINVEDAISQLQRHVEKHQAVVNLLGRGRAKKPVSYP